MEAAQSSPGFSSCCFAPSWRGILSNKRPNQVVPASVGDSRPDPGPPHVATLGSNQGKRDGSEEAFVAAMPLLPQQADTESSPSGADYCPGAGGLQCLTTEIGEKGNAVCASSLGLEELADSPNSSSQACEPIPAGTSLWDALLHQSPTRQLSPMRNSGSSGQLNLENMVGSPGSRESEGIMPLSQGRASPKCVLPAVWSSFKHVDGLLPADNDTAPFHVLSSSPKMAMSSRAPLCRCAIAEGLPGSCLQCVASSGAFHMMCSYWEQAEQRAREAEAMVKRMERNEKQMAAQLAALLKQVELRQILVDRLSGLVSQQQVAHLPFVAPHSLHSSLRQGLKWDHDPTNAAAVFGDCSQQQEASRESSPRGETELWDGGGGSPLERFHQPDERRGVAESFSRARGVPRGVSLDAWAEPRDSSDTELGPSCSVKGTASGDDSFEFDTSPLAVLDASPAERGKGPRLPGVRRQRRRKRGGVRSEDGAGGGHSRAGRLAAAEVGWSPSSQGSRQNWASPRSGRVRSEAGTESDASSDHHFVDTQGPGESGNREVVSAAVGQERIAARAFYGEAEVGSGQAADSPGDATQHGHEIREGGLLGENERIGQISLAGESASSGKESWGRVEAEADAHAVLVKESWSAMGGYLEVQGLEGGMKVDPEVVGCAMGGRPTAGAAEVEGEEAYQLDLAELEEGKGLSDRMVQAACAARSPQGDGLDSWQSDERNGESLVCNSSWEQSTLMVERHNTGLATREISHEVVVEGFAVEEGLPHWSDGSVADPRRFGSTFEGVRTSGSPPESPLMKTFRELHPDGFGQLASPVRPAEDRRSAWGGSSRLVPHSPREPRAKAPSPRVVSPRDVERPPTPTPAPVPSSSHTRPLSCEDTVWKASTDGSTETRAFRVVKAPQNDLASAARRVDARAGGRLPRRDSLPGRNGTSDPFGLQEPGLFMPHPPSSAATKKTPSSREKQLVASTSGKKSGDKENDWPKVPTLTLRLEGLGGERRLRECGSGKEPRVIGVVKINEVTSPEPPPKPRPTTSRPHFRALRPQAT